MINGYVSCKFYRRDNWWKKERKKAWRNMMARGVQFDRIR